MDNEVPQADIEQGCWEEAKGTHSAGMCISKDIQIIKVHVSRDHVHMMVSVPRGEEQDGASQR